MVDGRDNRNCCWWSLFVVEVEQTRSLVALDGDGGNSVEFTSREFSCFFVSLFHQIKLDVVISHTIRAVEDPHCLWRTTENNRRKHVLCGFLSVINKCII